MHSQKTCNENPLRLKRGCVERNDQNVPEEFDCKYSGQENSTVKKFKKDNIECNVLCEHQDDSILDFKSPQPKGTEEQKHARHKKSTAINRRNEGNSKFKLLSNSKSKKAKENAPSKKKSCTVQTSIESSFFKPKAETESNEISKTPSNTKTALLCPLCFKSCKDSDSQIIHMKICAIKNNVSTEKLLNALELQKRQEDERKSLGLLAAPIVQDRKKTMSRKLNSYENSDFELALALSKSLHEVEEANGSDNADASYITTDVRLSETTEFTHGSGLEKFGFACKKPPILGKVKKRKHIGPTLLQTRSQEERNRILTEKIAEILMGNEIQSQASQENKHVETVRTKCLLKSFFLQKHCCRDQTLWNTTYLTDSQKYFYVTELSNHITAQNVILPDELPTENTAVNDTELPCNEPKEQELESLYGTQNASCLKPLNDYTDNRNDKYNNTLTIDWANTLNDSAFSDILIFVDNDKYIWTHKLVFYVRCSNILLDVTANDDARFTNIKEKICWHDVHHQNALAFLEFVYCGVIEKHANATEDRDGLSSLRKLARKYKLKQLFDYLDGEKVMMQKQLREKNCLDNEVNVITINTSPEITEPEQNTNDCNTATDMDCVPSYTDNTLTPETDDNKTTRHFEENEECLINEIKTRQRSVSPDMFDDTDDVNRDTTKRFDRTLGSQEIKEDGVFDLLLAAGTDSDNKFLSRSLNIMDNIDITGSPEAVRRCSKEAEEKVCSRKSLLCSPTNSSKRKAESAVINKTDIDVWGESFLVDDIDIELKGYSVDSSKRSECNEKSSEKQNFYDEQPTFSNSSVNVSTPKSSKSGECKENMITKQRSNLSIFIEKFRRDNAKLDLDSDSDMDALQVSARRNRNPFNVNVMNDSEGIAERRDILTVQQPERQTGLDVFDKSTQLSSDDEIGGTANEDQRDRFELNLTQTNSNENISPASVKSGTSDSLLVSDLEDDEEVSMYTRYKRKNKENSINKYRSARLISEERHINNERSSASSLQRRNCADSNYTTDVTEAKCITILSDSESCNENSADSPMTETNNESRDTLIRNILSRSNESASSHYRDNANIIKSDGESGDTSCKRTDLEIHKTARKSRDLGNTSRLKYSKSDSNIQLNRLSMSRSPPCMGTHRSEMVSPVLISSSPEMDMDQLKSQVQNKKYLNLTEFADIDHILENDVYLANVHLESVNGTFKETTQLEKHFISSPLSNDKLSNNVNAPDRNEGGRPDALENLPVNASQKGGRMKENVSIRKFHRKSISEGNFHFRAENIVHDKSRLEGIAGDLCECGQRKIYKGLSEPIIVRDNVSPPPNYDRMSTPELQKELKRYGLKLQKRNRAVKLLAYIYDELHPVTSTARRAEINRGSANSDNDEPPMKRLSQSNGETRESRDEYLLTQQRDDGYPIDIIAEETQFEEPDSQSVPENPGTIKEAFSRLIKSNKDLHNKVLMYEPLSIESLHAQLKAEGLKCRMNALMDFLDEQCITFYIQENNRNRTKKN